MFLFLKKKEYHYLNKVIISQAALEENHQLLQAAHPEIAVCPVLKSNAYGHGMHEVAPLFDAMACEFLIVDSLFEAYELHKLRVKTPILILGYTAPENFKVKHLPFEFAVFDLEVAKTLNEYQPGSNIHIFVDTGMSREGLTLEELPHFLIELKKLKNVSVTGLCSHFADADNPDSFEFSKAQISTYKQALQLVHAAGFSPKWRHISGSAGSLKLKDSDFTLIRAGLAHYGISPLDTHDKNGQDVALQPVLEFVSTLAQVKKISPGSKIGYNCTYQTKKAMTIGLLPIGYYDGVDRRLSNKGCVKIREQFFPIVGKVSMNMTVIDISKLKNPVVGEKVIIYSAHQTDKNSLDNAAEIAGTIPYELVVHIAESVKRVVARNNESN